RGSEAGPDGDRPPEAAPRANEGDRLSPFQSRMAPGDRSPVDADGGRGGDAVRARARGEPGRAQPHRFPQDRRCLGQKKQRDRAGRSRDEVVAVSGSGNAARAETAPGEMKMAEATLRIIRGGPEGGEPADYRVPIAPGMVVLDALHHIQGYHAPDLAVRW